MIQELSHLRKSARISIASPSTYSTTDFNSPPFHTPVRFFPQLSSGLSRPNKQGTCSLKRSRIPAIRHSVRPKIAKTVKSQEIGIMLVVRTAGLVFPRSA